jgi:hypothetical protein
MASRVKALAGIYDLAQRKSEGLGLERKKNASGRAVIY